MPADRSFILKSPTQCGKEFLESGKSGKQLIWNINLFALLCSDD